MSSFIDENNHQNVSNDSIDKIQSTKSFATPGKTNASMHSLNTPKSSTSTFKSTSALKKNVLKSGLAKPMTPSTPRSPSTGSTTSIGSQAREAARLAKEQSTKERIQKVSELKIKWAKEKEQKLHDYQTKKESNIAKQQQIANKLAEQRKINLEKQKQIEYSLKESEREELVAYSKDRVHTKNEQERIEKEKRRYSILLRAELNTKFKINHNKIINDKDEYENNLLQSRRLDAISVKEHQRQEDEKKRISLLFRNEMAQKQKMIELQVKETHDEYERSWIQTRYLNWQDEQNYKKELNEQRRVSLINRNETWSKQKHIELEIEYQNKDIELSLLQSRYEDWKDIEAYKKDQAKRDRESLQGRWLKYLHDRSIEEQLKAQEDELMEYEYELRRQGYEDVKKYQESEQMMRRKSLVYRLEKARKDRDFDKSQQEIIKYLEIEEQRLRQQDREDVETYYQNLQNARRVSLEYRNQLETQERLRLEGVKQAQYDKEQIDRELSDLAWKDVQEYQEKLRDGRRKSLAQRLVEARKQKLNALEEHRKKLDNLHNELNSRRVDWIATEESIEDEKKRRRFSLALRLDSWRIQRLAEEKLNEKKRLIEEENMRYRAQDWEDLQLYKEQLKLKEKELLLNPMII